MPLTTAAISSGRALDFRWYGAVPDATKVGGRWVGTDNSAALQAALTDMATKRLPLCAPAGSYRFLLPPGQFNYLGVVPSWCVIFGESRAATEFCVDFDPNEVVSVNKGNVLLTTPDPFGLSVNAGNFALNTYELFDLSNIRIRSLLTDHPSATRFFTGMRIRNTQRVSIVNCDGFEVSGLFASNLFNEECRFINNHLDKIASVGLRNLGGERTFYLGNFLKRVDDDAIDCHLANQATIPRGLVVVNGNIIEDGEGIAVFGARHMAITNNVLRRTRRTCIQADGWTDGEGRGSMGSLVVANNVIENPLGSVNFTDPTSSAWLGQNDWWAGIEVGGGVISSVGTTNGAYPGWYDTVAAKVLDMWAVDGTNPKHGAQYTPDWTLAASPAGQGIFIGGNVVRRTLPAFDKDGGALHYSDWGLGNYWRNIGECDPVIDEELTFRKHGICVRDATMGTTVSGNFLAGFRYGAGIYLEAQTNLHNLQDFFWLNMLIDSNNIMDVLWGITSNFRGFASTFGVDIEIARNKIDVDPFFKSQYRTSPLDGSWTNAATLPGSVAFDLRRLQGWVLRDNTAANCLSPIAGTLGYESVNLLLNNVLRLDHAGNGYNAANKGIGIQPAASTEWIYLTTEGDPTTGSAWRKTK